MTGAPVSATRKQRISRSREQWRDLVMEQRRSGLGLGAFCQRVGASTAAFGKWRKHFAETPEPEPAARTRAVLRKRDAARADEKAATFVEIASPMRPLKTGVKLRLDLGGGIVLEVVRV